MSVRNSCLSFNMGNLKWSFKFLKIHKNLSTTANKSTQAIFLQYRSVTVWIKSLMKLQKFFTLYSLNWEARKIVNIRYRSLHKFNKNKLYPPFQCWKMNWNISNIDNILFEYKTAHIFTQVISVSHAYQAWIKSL